MTFNNKMTTRDSVTYAEHRRGAVVAERGEDRDRYHLSEHGMDVHARRLAKEIGDSGTYGTLFSEEVTGVINRFTNGTRGEVIEVLYTAWCKDVNGFGQLFRDLKDYLDKRFLEVERYPRLFEDKELHTKLNSIASRVGLHH